MQKLFPLLAALLLAAPASADDLDRFLRRQDAQSGGAAPVASQPVNPANPECANHNPALRSGGDCTAQTFCHDLESCEHFCCACDRTVPIAGEWWNEPVYDDKVTCPRAPQTADGMIAPDSTDLKSLATELRGKDGDHLLGLGTLQATQAVVDGLKQLNGIIKEWPNKPDGQEIKVRVKSCYRRAIGNPTNPPSNQGNAEAVCGMVFKLLHVDNSATATAANKAEWHTNAGNKWGMTWPGPTPHASGFACDIVLTDAAGTDCFDVATGANSRHHCTIDDKTASALLDDAVTQTGGWRLDFEAWHYEWGGGHTCRCQHPNCADHFYPATGNQSQCP